MLLGYNTNGLSHHRLPDAIRVLADLGYQSVAITLDHVGLNPYSPGFASETDEIRRLLDGYAMRSVIETGARFLLDAQTKHEPTLMTADEAQRQRRIEFLRRSIDLSVELGADCVSLWSGILRGRESDEQGLERLANGLRELLEYAGERGVVLAFEPEPGMFVDTTARFERLLQWVDAENLQLTIDVGHLYCQGEVPIVDYLERWGPRIANVHLEDMRAGVHEHLMFGEGEMDFPPIIDALARLPYHGAVHVELSRHSHVGPAAAKQAYEFLRPMIDESLRKNAGL